MGQAQGRRSEVTVNGIIVSSEKQRKRALSCAPTTNHKKQEVPSKGSLSARGPRREQLTVQFVEATKQAPILQEVTTNEHKTLTPRGMSTNQVKEKIKQPISARGAPKHTYQSKAIVKTPPREPLKDFSRRCSYSNLSPDLSSPKQTKADFAIYSNDIDKEQQRKLEARERYLNMMRSKPLLSPNRY
ncbi:tegument protein VP16 [Acrasis kona]|uniref:Tegument protein VP16 n=1 Tax=Acrasis kona TaxID=1008807 RepID=A0AAW2ZNC2_9EUKA